MTMNQFIPANTIEIRCDEWLGPFRCELNSAHEGPHQWDSRKTWAFSKEIGNVLDHWEQLPNDFRSDPTFDALDKALQKLYNAINSKGWEPKPRESTI